MSEQHPNIIVALSTQHKTAMLILQRALERGLSAGELRIFDDIAELRDFPSESPIVCVAPAIDRTGALLDEIIVRNGWLSERGIDIIALCYDNDAHITDRLFRAGVHDCWPADPESLSSLAAWIIRYVQRESFKPKENKSDADLSAGLAEDVRRKTYRETAASISHHIISPLSAILAISERALMGADLGSAESERLRQIYECAEHILGVTNELLDSDPPDSIETAAGAKIDLSSLRSEETKIAALARRRFAFKSLPETLTNVSVTSEV